MRKRLDILAEKYSKQDSQQTGDLLERLCGYTRPDIYSTITPEQVRVRRLELYRSPELGIVRVTHIGPKRKIVLDQVTVVSESGEVIEAAMDTIDRYFLSIPLIFERNGFPERFQFRRDTK